jgi:hypothetical protein
MFTLKISQTMSAFEYLSVLISIILAMGMTRVLAGVGEMLQARSHRQIYWVHVHCDASVRQMCHVPRNDFKFHRGCSI